MKNRWWIAPAVVLGTLAAYGAVYLAAYALVRPLHRDAARWIAPLLAMFVAPELTRLLPWRLTDRERSLLLFGGLGALLGGLLTVLVGVLFINWPDLWSAWGGTIAAVCIVGTGVGTAYLRAGAGPAFRQARDLR